MTALTGREVLNLLESFGEIEWARWGTIDGNEENLKFPPVVVWRYKKRDENLERLIVEAVNSFHGNVQWEIRLTTRNWIVTPKRVLQIMDERQYYRGSQAIVALANEAPEFGEKANEDLPRIAAHIKRAVEQRTDRGASD